MSKLSFVEKLLDGVEVEWRPLGEVGEVRMCKRILKHQTSETGDIPFYKIGTFGKEPNAYIARELFNEYKAKYSYPRTGEILISASGTIGRTVIFDGQDAYFQDSNIVWIENDESQILNKFLFYVYEMVNWNVAEGGTIKRLYNDILKKTPIPIPPLAVQAEIVRILDAFMGLTAELTAVLTTELTARQKQYTYYRDQLLTFAEGKVDHVPMGQEGIGEFIRGGGLQKKDFTETGVGCIHYGQIYTHYGTYADKTKTYVSKEFAKKARKAKTGDLVIATTSETDEDVCKAVAWLGSEDIAVSSDACIYRHNLNPKYVAYFFQTEQFQKQKRQYITGTKVRRVNADNLAKISIPIPSPEEQARIVAILDKFDTLTNSISRGLPREIALRQQQYEYYREQLLSFPQPEGE
ncbi:MAG: restriction endonuclease subunit S [Anaerolineales bacterium]|nr:restriction endonuclease subunit S [Anaerolineales bacterium]